MRVDNWLALKKEQRHETFPVSMNMFFICYLLVQGVT